jgi:hypothetical protein
VALLLTFKTPKSFSDRSEYSARKHLLPASNTQILFERFVLIFVPICMWYQSNGLVRLTCAASNSAITVTFGHFPMLIAWASTVLDVCPPTVTRITTQNIERIAANDIISEIDTTAWKASSFFGTGKLSKNLELLIRGSELQ